MHDKPVFRWKCSYFGCCEYEAHDVCYGSMILEVRHTAGAYERQIATGYNDDEWQRCVVAAVGTIVWRNQLETPVPERIVQAFNDWRSANFETFYRDVTSQPERYGDDVAEWAEQLRPTPVVGAHYCSASRRIVRADEEAKAAA